MFPISDQPRWVNAKMKMKQKIYKKSISSKNKVHILQCIGNLKVTEMLTINAML